MPIAAARLSWAFHGLAVSSGCGRQEADTVAALESTGTKSAEPPESLAGSPPSNGLAESRQPEASAQAQQPQALAEARQPQSLAETQQPQSLDQAQLPQNLTEAQQPQGLTEEWHLEDLAGSWRLDGQKTTEKLQDYDSLQSLWGTGLSYGSDMEIGADGSFSFYITINYGGIGTLTETEGGLLAEGIVPHAPDENTSTPDSLLIVPVIEDGTLYLTTECYGESMYWIQYDDAAAAGRAAMEAPDAYKELIAAAGGIY